MAWTWTPFTITVIRPNTIQMVGDLMASHDPDPSRSAVYAGIDGIAGLMASTGMIYAPHRGPLGSLAITGGGHAAYAGNEVYVFDLSTYRWSRINNPSTAGITPLVRGTGPDLADYVYGEYPDGTPSANHNYSALTAIPGGAKGLLLLPSKPAISWGGGRNSPWAHVCDLETGVWSRYSTNAGPQVNGVGSERQVLNVCCYDASRNCVWGLPRGLHNALTKLDLDTRTFIPQAFPYCDIGYNPTCAKYPVNDHMLIMTGIGYYGQPTRFTLGAINLSNTGAGMTVLTLAGELIPDGILTAYGFDWDTDQNCGYVFPGNWNYDRESAPGQRDMNHVYRVDAPTSGGFATGTWNLTKITLPQSLPLSKSDGTYSRWRYIPSIKKFAYLAREIYQVALWTPP